MSQLIVDAPDKLLPLLQPARYKAAYGGRGGAKSHFFAEQIIIRCYARKTRVACIREVQATIKDSVRQLLVDKIQKLGLGEEFDCLETEIRCKRNGSLIVFKGMQAYNAQNIKSLEDFDIAWVEEAQTLSETSLRLLRPTIRKDGSELWFSWNPRHESDAVDKFFRGGNPPANSVIREVNWNDNPWFPDVLREEKDTDYANDPEVAENVWGGGYELITEAAYYAKYVSKAEKESRVGFFPYNPKLPVLTSWDIGVDDYTAVWFWQEDGFNVTAIDYYEVSGDGAEQIVAAALPELIPNEDKKHAALQELGRDAPFNYGNHFFPHDVMNREWGAGAKSRFQTLRELGVKPIHVGAQQGPEERINALRAMFPCIRFHDTKRVKLGLSRLRRYSRKKNQLTGIYTGILHDENSHGADAAGEFAVNCSIRPPRETPKPKAQESVYEATPTGAIVSNMSVREAVDAMVARRKRR